ncbi:calpain-1 catalytic subunit-like isoform X1 [Crassostrea virginica]
MSSPYRPPTDVGGTYIKNELGQFEKRVDFRSRPEEYDQETRPNVPLGQLYTDEQFPLSVAMGNRYNRDKLEWKRPPEFARNPCLFSKGTARYDIGQGSIGTCWFLASVANVADNRILLKRIIPKDSYPVGTSEYDGIFHCRFWRFGVWDDVFIDDYLPIIYGNQIYSARSNTDPNEMWVPLLEKAFARLYGSYTEVSGGSASDSYMALTGGVPEDINLKELTIEPEQLHTRVRNALSSGAAVTCSTSDEFERQHGLLGSHVYTLNGAVTVRGTRLFRLRNPWGSTEWTGPYSDGSEEWKRIERYVDAPNRDDGEFYISLDYVLYFFSSLTICNITPDFDRDGSPDSLKYCTCLYGQWQGEETGGFRNKINNPKFQFEVCEQSVQEDGKVPFVVQIIQRTLKRKARKLTIRADLYRVLETESTDLLVLQEEGIPSENNLYQGNTQTSFRFTLRPGKYVCIPSTGREGQEWDFMLRLYSAGPLRDIKKIDSKKMTVMTCSGVGIDKYNHTKCLTGRWTAGSNAGGQISHRTFHINPQIKINVSKNQWMRFQLLTDSEKPTYPIGFMLFKLGNSVAPVDQNWLYRKYDDAVKTTEGRNGSFIMGSLASAKYYLRAGSYLCLLHMDDPNTEKPFALVVRSYSPLRNVETYQMQ